MKFLLSIDHIGMGGAQRVSVNLLNWLSEHTDTEVHLVLNQRVKNEGFKKEIESIPYFYLEGNIIQKICQLRKILKRINPDVFLTMGTPQAIFDVPACIGLNTKHIISERNSPMNFSGKRIVKLFSHSLMRLADAYVFQTAGARDYYGGRVAKNSTIIPNPLFNTDELPSIPYQGEREKIIVSVGRLHKQKNHELLIRAFAAIADRLPEYKLIIYGEGSLRSTDEKLIEDLILKDKVLLPGTITNIPGALYKASLFVLSSNFEGMPNVLIEAMAMGVPCVSTDCPCGGPRELITEGVSGRLVKVGNQEELSKTMLEMISNPSESNKMGQKAMVIRDWLDINRICNMWYNYLIEVSNR